MDNYNVLITVLIVSIFPLVSGVCQVGFIVDNEYIAYIDGVQRLVGDDHTKKTNTNITTSNTVIAIAAHNNQGASGFLVTSEGDIYTSNQTNTPVIWRCIRNNGTESYLANNEWAGVNFNDGAWPICYEIGDITTSPWKTDKEKYVPVNSNARWLWTHNPGYNYQNDFNKTYTDGDVDILIRGTFTLTTDCNVASATTTTPATTEAVTTVTTTTTTQGVVVTAAAAASTDSGLSTTTIVLLALLGVFILALLIGLLIFCCCCRQGGAVAANEKSAGIYNGRPVAHVPVTSKLGDLEDNYFVETDGSTSNLVALPKDGTTRVENGYYY